MTPISLRNNAKEHSNLNTWPLFLHVSTERRARPTWVCQLTSFFLLGGIQRIASSRTMSQICHILRAQSAVHLDPPCIFPNYSLFLVHIRKSITVLVRGEFVARGTGTKPQIEVGPFSIKKTSPQRGCPRFFSQMVSDRQLRSPTSSPPPARTPARQTLPVSMVFVYAANTFQCSLSLILHSAASFCKDYCNGRSVPDRSNYDAAEQDLQYLTRSTQSCTFTSSQAMEQNTIVLSRTGTRQARRAAS